MVLKNHNVWSHETRYHMDGIEYNEPLIQHTKYYRPAKYSITKFYRIDRDPPL